jgi:hypothetical protein
MELTGRGDEDLHQAVENEELVPRINTISEWPALTPGFH